MMKRASVPADSQTPYIMNLITPALMSFHLSFSLDLKFHKHVCNQQTNVHCQVPAIFIIYNIS